MILNAFGSSQIHTTQNENNKFLAEKLVDLFKIIGSKSELPTRFGTALGA